MDNLLQETIDSLTFHEKNVSDVLWVGSFDGEYSMAWEEFAIIANVDYDDGFGSQKIAKDLVVVGRGWWMERGEYDGSEWWDFKTKPVRKTKTKPFRWVEASQCGVVGWESLADLNARNEVSADAG